MTLVIIDMIQKEQRNGAGCEINQFRDQVFMLDDGMVEWILRRQQDLNVRRTCPTFCSGHMKWLVNSCIYYSRSNKPTLEVQRAEIFCLVSW